MYPALTKPKISFQKTFNPIKVNKIYNLLKDKKFSSPLNHAISQNTLFARQMKQYETSKPI